MKAYLFNRHLLFELLPGAVFFLVNVVAEFNSAVAALIASTAISAMLSWRIERRIPVFPFVSVIFVFILGGLTIYFENETFVKFSATLGKIIFAAMLLLGLLVRPCLLARALEGEVYLTDAGWKILTLRWVLLALIFAILNEIVWRRYETDTWVLFKSLVMPLSIMGYIIITRITAPRYWQEPVRGEV